jgi:hypothetical protein
VAPPRVREREMADARSAITRDDGGPALRMIVNHNYRY